MKTNILILAFLCTILSYSQTLYKAKLTLGNGETKEGFAGLPSNGFSNSVLFKPEKKGKSSKINSDDIINATYYSDNGNAFYFEHTQIRQLFGDKERIAKRKVWILATYASDHLTAYDWGQSYRMDKEGKMITQSGNSGGWAEIFICFKRQGEELPSSITSYTYGAQVIGQDKRFRKAAIFYFEGEDLFTKRIEDKEWTHEQIYEMAKAYTAYKGN